MSNSETILEGIRQRRETRDRLLFQHSIPILEQLRNVVNSWVDGEFHDLEDELSHVDDFAVRDRASETISRFRTNITRIRNEELPQALKDLDELIEFIKEQKYESAQHATQTLSEKIRPILSVIFSLTSARNHLDSMADMIPIPTIEEIQTDE
jgi:glutamyl-tRNA reductase